MMGFIVSLLFFSIMFPLSSLTVTPPLGNDEHPVLCHANELSALLQFNKTLIINCSASLFASAYPKVVSWNLEDNNLNCCSWDGVKCHEHTGHVIRLDLTSSCLYGSINSISSLFKLVHLQWLSLADNDFSRAKITSGIINLSMLSHLNLSGSSISGQLPSEMLHLFNLESLDLSRNHLEFQEPGMITPVGNSKSNLKMLNLSDCQLKGEFPKTIVQLPSLVSLKVMNNPGLTGIFPEFPESNSLEELVLRNTSFFGSISYSIGNLKSLSYLDLRYCLFSGSVPPSLGNLTKLVLLDLSYNELSGIVPPSLGNLGSLQKLDISACNFSGKIPSFISNLTELTYLGLSNNSFSSQNSASLSWISKHIKLTKLSLSNLNLVGEIPIWLTNLTQLTYLDMNWNQVTGSIPYWLTSMRQIEHLFIFSNQLIGDIPSQIGNLTRLNSLELSSNQLQGTIPHSIFQLNNLQFLGLESNSLHGTVKLEMFLLKLKRLKVLNLSWNNLSLLTNSPVNNTSQKFWFLGLASCNLGEFPNFLHNQDELVGLQLSFNQITGQIPVWFFNVSVDTLKVLDLYGNFLTGFGQNPVVLPWNNLLTLDLSNNKLQGPLPVPPVSILHYLLSNNSMTGEILPWMCILNNLCALDLSFNDLSGILPQCLGNFSRDLFILELQSNRFHGTIPQSFMKGSRLEMIDLNHNKLQGKIPRSLTNCSRLEFLDLGNNQISDRFPSWLGCLRELKVMILRSNRLHGVIREPETDFEFSKLHIIDLSYNRFTGKLPSKYFQLWNAMKIVPASQLTYMQQNLTSGMIDEFAMNGSLDYLIDYSYSMKMIMKGLERKYEKISNGLTSIILSNNRFVGEIPASIGNLKGLRILNLSNNYLEGHIPSSIGKLSVLESLDLSNNKLSGEIPQQLTKLTFLEVFDVSCNDLTGLIPHGNQFNTFENSSFDGNPGLCGRPLSKECERPGASESFPEEEGDQGSDSVFAFHWTVVLIGYASGLIFGVLLGRIFTTRKPEWFVKIYGRQLKLLERKKRQRKPM